MKPASDRNISVEDLLRLKRAERPPPVFWESFDKELRARQLAAIVERRPWWQGLAGALARRQVAIGAAAAFLVAVAGAGHLGHTYAERTVVQTASADTAPAAAPVQAAFVSRLPASVARAGLQPATEAASAPAGSASTTELSAPLADIPLIAAFPSQSEHLIAVNLTSVQAPQAELARLAYTAQPMSVRSEPITADPLSRIDPASQERRMRLMASALPVASIRGASVTGVSTTRIAQDLDDDRLSESISRYGVGGDRFSIRF